MLGQTYDSQNCSIARSLELVGERWSLLILRDAIFRRKTRFADFQRSLGLASNVLSARLERFVDEGLMERQQSSETKYYEYVLTEKGLSLAPALIALRQWGDEWAAPLGPPVLAEHAECGGPVEQRLACNRCGETVSLDEIASRPGPGSQSGGRQATSA